MAGSQGIQQGPRVLIIAIALAAAIAAAAQAQTPSLPSPTPPSDFASVVGGPETFVQPTFTQPTGAVPSYYAGEGSAPTAPIVEMGLFDTITESIFGQPDPNTWRPLPLSTLFSEGWNEAWVPSPNGSGGAPRQGWINAMDGNLYRLWFFTFAQGFNNAPRGNAYLGSYTLLTPLSRRLELIINIPFVVRNNAVTGLPIIDPNRPSDADDEEPLGFRRHVVHAPLLAARDEGLLAHSPKWLGVDPDRHPAPCGETTALIPAFGFWNNFAGRCVIRGGLGLGIPIQGSGDEPDQPARHRSDIHRS